MTFIQAASLYFWGSLVSMGFAMYLIYTRPWRFNQFTNLGIFFALMFCAFCWPVFIWDIARKGRGRR